ncbi:MAG TPA: histone deacetylase [Verrucomicrobiae bacterium]|nr:histone deacetylase [Verrucomicrobiae bacterium]
MVIITDERCTGYHTEGHPEKPARITGSLELLRTQTSVELTWAEPLETTQTMVARAHTAAHIERVKHAHLPFDSDTWAHPGIYYHALRSAGGAVLAMQEALAGKPVFSLLRPPGHHATKERAMGFCYFNSVAIAVLEAKARGVERIGILDFDVHHGNGTEDILVNQPGVVFASVHQMPCYPGTGATNVGQNCFNFPIRPFTQREPYRGTFSEALARVISIDPQLIAVSAGFDAYVKDRIAQQTLEAEDFHWMGGELRKTGIPFFSLLEGGYSDDLPELILAYLKGVCGK